MSNDGSDLGNLSKELEEAKKASSDDSEQSNDTEAETADEPTQENEDTSDTDPYTDPAFPYSDVVQDARYVRGTTDTKWEDARDLEVERALRQHDVRNVAGREYDDALFRLGAEHPELVAKYVMEARGLDAPDDLGEE